MSSVLEWLRAGAAQAGLAVVSTLLLGWLGLFLTHRREERESRREATLAWKETAEARAARLADLTDETKQLECALEEAEAEANKLRAESAILYDAYSSTFDEAEALRAGIEHTRTALHRAGLVMVANYEIFERGRRLQVCQEKALNAVIDEAIGYVCAAFEVDHAAVRALLDSDDAVPDPSLMGVASIAAKFENVRLRAELHGFAPVQNVFLGAKVAELIRINNTSTLEELHPKYWALVKEDTEELFKSYPGEAEAHEQASAAASVDAAFSPFKVTGEG